MCRTTTLSFVISAKTLRGIDLQEATVNVSRTVSVWINLSYKSLVARLLVFAYVGYTVYTDGLYL